jgi:hypothetical protein
LCKTIWRTGATGGREISNQAEHCQILIHDDTQRDFSAKEVLDIHKRPGYEAG